MSFIPGVSLNPSGHDAAARPATDVPRGAGAVGRGETPVTAGGVLTGSQSINHVYFAVSSMMQSVGGGIENDKMLRMMIALMIIMALLEQQQGATQDDGGQRAPSSPGAGGLGSSFSFYTSSTTITVQETAVVFGAEASGAYAGQNQGTDPADSELDISI